MEGVPLLEMLSDAELDRVNRMLPWTCFTVDSKGRRLGVPFSATKRATEQVIPDQRLVDFHSYFDISKSSVLEVGCYEGVHTVGLCQTGATVCAADGRIENVIKTIARCMLYGVFPDVIRLDVDSTIAVSKLQEFDFVHHIGVLYHLTDPAGSLSATLEKTKRAMLLDTHVVKPGEGTSSINIGGVIFETAIYREGGISDPFSGLSAHSVWLSLDAILFIAERSGFNPVRLDIREERNGRRVLVYLSKR